MFIINLSYKKPETEVSKVRAIHREYLDKFYASNNLLYVWYEKH